MPWALAGVRSWVRPGVAGEPQRCDLGPGDDLHVHSVLAVLRRAVRLVRGDPVDGGQGAVNDDVVAFTEAGEGFTQAGRPVGQDVQRFVDVPPGDGLGYSETGSELRERLVLPQMAQREECLLEAAELAPAGVASSAVLVKQPGNMLNQLSARRRAWQDTESSGPPRHTSLARCRSCHDRPGSKGRWAVTSRRWTSPEIGRGRGCGAAPVWRASGRPSSRQAP